MPTTVDLNFRSALRFKDRVSLKPPFDRGSDLVRSAKILTIYGAVVGAIQDYNRRSRIPRFADFLRDESGLGFSEYSLLLAFLVLASGALFVTERHVAVAIWFSLHPVLKVAHRLLHR